MADKDDDKSNAGATASADNKPKGGLNLRPSPEGDDKSGGTDATATDAEKAAANKPAAPVPDAKAISEEAARIATEALERSAKAKNPTPGPEVQKAMENARKPPLRGSEAARSMGEETVTMIFPRDVMLTLNDHSRIHFDKGPQEVPVSLSNHQYLKRNGVKPYKK